MIEPFRPPELIVFGIPEVMRRTGQVFGSLERALPIAMYRGMETVIGLAKPLTPVDKGILRSSGHAEQPRADGGWWVVRGLFGGPARAYALIVHEQSGVRHTVGGRKYLEKAWVIWLAEGPAELVKHMRQLVPEMGR